jgi:hypothetical protein
MADTPVQKVSEINAKLTWPVTSFPVSSQQESLQRDSKPYPHTQCLRLQGIFQKQMSLAQSDLTMDTLETYGKLCSWSKQERNSLQIPNTLITLKKINSGITNTLI